MTIAYSDFIDYLFQRSTPEGIPLSGTFELTSRCNLDCSMCYIHKRANDMEALKRELSKEEWISLGEKARENGMLLLLLTGGEPLLRTDFKEIYLALKKMGFLLMINTNGTLLDEEMADFLAAYPPVKVNVTLYGSSPETYERLCGSRVAYKRAYRAVSLLMERKLPVKINFSVSPVNSRDLEDVFSFVSENDLRIQVAPYMFPPVRACELCESTNERITAEEAAEIMFRYDEFRMGREMMVRRGEAILSGKSIDEIEEITGDTPSECIRCRAGSTTFWVTYDGQMRPCGMMQVPTVKDDFRPAWETIKREREKIMLPAQCTACPIKEACIFCPAACYAENGCFEESPEYVCAIMKSYLGRYEKLLEEENENK